MLQVRKYMKKAIHYKSMFCLVEMVLTELRLVNRESLLTKLYKIACNYADYQLITWLNTWLTKIKSVWLVNVGAYISTYLT